MKNYELLYILPSSMTGEEVKTAFMEVEKNILKLGGKKLETLLDHPFLVKAETLKENTEELKGLPIIKRRLAYPIKKNRTGFYCLFNFSSEPCGVKEIDNYLRMNNAVIRHLTIQADPITKEKIQLLEKLFARKKAEQEKEKKEKSKPKEKEEVKKEKIIPKKEDIEIAGKEKIEEEKKVTEEIKETKDTHPLPLSRGESKEEKKKPEEEEKEVKEKTAAKKKKIKLEDLEEKLDEILEDTSII